MARSIAELTAIAHRHAAAEADGNLAATLATLEPDPVYELYPVGLRMTGLPLARRYYEHFFARTAPRIVGKLALPPFLEPRRAAIEAGLKPIS